MRRLVIIVPDWLGEPGGDTLFDQSLPGLQVLADRGTLSKLSIPPPVECEEALWLGLDPDNAGMRPGPLQVSAFKADPPARSTQFCLTLLAHNDGQVEAVTEFNDEELASVIDLARKLNTRDLTLVVGEGDEHALVHEQYLEMQTVPSAELVGQAIAQHLPVGDAEVAIRRYIDDSINLLSEQEFNVRRVDQGKTPLNLLWPWGHGQRLPLPNLALQRGAPAQVFGSSLRLAGLARLVGYQPMDRRKIGRGMQTRFEELLTAIEPSVVAFESIREKVAVGQLDEARWLTRELDIRLLQPLADLVRTEPTRVTIVAPTANGGLTLTTETGPGASGNLPFDERSLDERGLATISISDAVEHSLVL